MREAEGRYVAAPVIALALVSCALGCSSKGGSPDSGNPFGEQDAAMEASSSSKDAGTKKDTGTPGEKSDGACGSVAGPDWCQTNAPMETDESNVQCDDFDTGLLSSAYQWEGVTRASLVNTRYVSPNCALTAQVAATTDLATTEHTYDDGVPSTGGATMAFDIYVPGDACEGVVVGWFNVVPGVTTPSGSLLAWIKLTSVTSSDYLATLSMATSVGGMFTSATPVSVHVTPSAKDNGWARLSLTISSYTLAASPTATTGEGTISWYAIGGKTPLATSTAINTSGQISSSGPTNVNFYVGVLADPATSGALTGCQIYIDDFVTNLTGAAP